MTANPSSNPIEITPAGTYGARVRGGPLMRAASGMFIGMVRVLQGRGPFKGIALLTTVGATSGKKRTAPVGAVPDGPGRWLVVGSNMGAAKHPAWFTNLARNPDQAEIELGGRTTKVTPSCSSGPSAPMRGNGSSRPPRASPSTSR